MKILFLTALFYPSIGGVETHVHEIAEELIKLGNQVTIVTEYGIKNHESRLKKLKQFER